MRMGQGVRTGLGQGGITCVLQTQFSSSNLDSSLSKFTNVEVPLYVQLPHKFLPF